MEEIESMHWLGNEVFLSSPNIYKCLWSKQSHFLHCERVNLYPSIKVGMTIRNVPNNRSRGETCFILAKIWEDIIIKNLWWKMYCFRNTILVPKLLEVHHYVWILVKLLVFRHLQQYGFSLYGLALSKPNRLSLKQLEFSNLKRTDP